MASDTEKMGLLLKKTNGDKEWFLHGKLQLHRSYV